MTKTKNNSQLNNKAHKIVGVSIIVIIAAIHWFRVGTCLNGDLYIYYYSYASDLMIPFSMYFLLSMIEIQWWFGM